VLRGDCGPIVVGEDSNIQDGTVCHTTGGVSELVVGARVTVGHGVVLHGCQIGDDCLIGMGSTLLDNAVIPPFSLVGAASFVPAGRRYEAGLIAGNPAVFRRALDDKLRAMIDDGHRAYRSYMAAFVAGEVQTLG
jgi:carbonic anhydrase/acetyltransferase-like protein (isoleucine patch superfamily)